MRQQNGRAQPAAVGGRTAIHEAGDYRFSGGETGSIDGTPGKPVVKIASILACANFHCVVSGLRLGYKTTRRLVRGQLRLLNHIVHPDSPHELPDTALRIIVDETRGCLREVADVSSEEFRRLQLELGKLQESVRAIIADPKSSPTQHRRHAKIKS